MRPPAAESPDGERPQERQTTMRGDDRRKRLTRERLIHERLIRERLIYELGMKTGVLIGAHTLAEQIGMSLPDARLRAIMEELPDEFIQQSYQDTRATLPALLAEALEIEESGGEE
jgi:hypothetical protein